MKKIPKRKYLKELRSFYFFPGRIILMLLSKRWTIKLLNFFEQFTRGLSIKGLQCEEIFIPSKITEGHHIRVRIFRPHKSKGKLPAMLYLHGGGYMIGNPEQFLSLYQQYIETRPTVIIVPDYRKSLKNPYPAGFNDCYETLLWIKENAQTLEVIEQQFIVGGHSAGGGLTAAISLKASHTKAVNIAFQMPLYPMLDHRQCTTSVQNMYHAPVLDSKVVKTAWSLYLKDLMDKHQPIPVYASPATNSCYNNLPPTISFVGSLDPLKDETISYINALKAAGIPTQFKLFKGAFHSFETIASNTSIAQEANTFQLQAFADYYDQFFINNT